MDPEFRTEMVPDGISRPIAFVAADRLTDVPSWHAHIPFAFWLIEAMFPRVLVELGTHRGDSYCAFAQAVDRLRSSTACYAIDTWRGDKHAGFYGEAVFEELQGYHDPRYGRFSRLIRSTFDNAASLFAEGSIDLLHIDGLHTYDAVKHDFETWRPKLTNRAVVLFHDIDERESDFGVWRLWDELARQFPSFAFHHSHGLGVLAVGADVAAPIVRLTGYEEAAARQVRLFFSRLGGALLFKSAHRAISAQRLRRARSSR
jgi:Methyltransferase domain